MTETQNQSAKKPSPPEAPEGFRGLIRQLWMLRGALWSSRGRSKLTILTIGIISTICATAGGQIILNAWNKPFYEAIAQRDFGAFSFQLLVFAAIASGLLIPQRRPSLASRDDQAAL